MKHVAPLRYDVIFRKAFSHPEIFTAFSKDFLGIDLQIDHVETEKVFAIPIGPVEPRFDLYAEDTANRVIVDIQHQRLGDHYDRFLYYHCVALLEQAAHSKTYHPDLKVFTLVVLTSGDKHKTDISIIDFDLKDLKGKSLYEIPHKVIYICPKYANEDTPPKLREWMNAIEDTLDEEVDESKYNPMIRHIFDLIEVSQITPAEGAKMKDEAAKEEKTRELEEEAKRREELGRQKEKIETAKNMLKEGLTVELISKVTGLTVKQIKKL